MWRYPIYPKLFGCYSTLTCDQLSSTCESFSPVHSDNKVEFNTVDFVESRLLPSPKPATKSTVAVYVQLCCRFWLRFCQQIRPKRRGRPCWIQLSTFSPVCTGLFVNKLILAKFGYCNNARMVLVWGRRSTSQVWPAPNKFSRRCDDRGKPKRAILHVGPTLMCPKKPDRYD